MSANLNLSYVNREYLKKIDAIDENLNFLGISIKFCMNNFFNFMIDGYYNRNGLEDSKFDIFCYGKI